MKSLMRLTLAAALLTAGCSSTGDDAGPAPSTTSSAVSSTSSTSAPTTSSSAASSTALPASTYTEPEQPVPAPAEQPSPVAQVPESPTFDPNSADGYGPSQELPPLCERFPGQYDCDGNPIPQQPAPGECVGFGCSPEQDAELAEVEGNATTLFWECMQAGGTEETCRQ